MPISIIIPTIGCDKRFYACLQSIRDSMIGSYEIIVVQDGFQEPLGVKVPNLKVVALPRRIGPGGARHTGARLAGGDVLLFIDADICFNRQAYERIMNTLDQSDVDAVFGVYSKNSLSQNFWSDYKNLYWHYNQVCLEPRSYSINTAVFAIKKKVYDEIGGFTESSLIGEDREIGKKLAWSQKVVCHDKQIVVDHLKSFQFRSLMKHHFENTVNLMALMLKWKKRSLKQKDILGAGRNQIRAIIFSGLTFLSFLAYLVFQKNLWILCLVFFLVYLMASAPFLAFGYRERGITFAFKALCLHYLESLSAALGVFVGLVRFYVLRNSEQNYKWGQGA